MSFSGPIVFALIMSAFYITISVEDIPVPGDNTTTTTNSPYTSSTTTTSTTSSPIPNPGFGHYITIRFNSVKREAETIVDDHVVIEHDGVIASYQCYPTFHWRLVYFIDQFIYHNTSHVSCATQPHVGDLNDCSCTCFDPAENKFIQIIL